MKINHVHAVYFSPTGNAKKVVTTLAQAIADTLGVPMDSYDFTLPESREKVHTYGADDLLVIGTPALVLQTVLIFFVAYGWAKWWKLPHDIAAPAGMIGASNFFELAVAVAISLFGLQSGAALATVVGVLVEVPVMLMLVRIANNTRKWFPITK